MAKIVLGSYMVRYPLGGILSWALQYLVGLKELGHDVYFVEHYAYDDSCYDPVRKVMDNDCKYGVKVVSELLYRFGLEGKWCFVEQGNVYHGLSKEQVRDVFQTADLFIDSGAHGAWVEESAHVPVRVYIDTDPVYTHFKLANDLKQGIPLPEFDYYFTVGRNVGSQNNLAPTLDIAWKHLHNPVQASLFSMAPPDKTGPYTTVMNWKSYPPVTYEGQTYGLKDVEFEKFIGLPHMVKAPMEVAVSGKQIPYDRLRENGWSVTDAQKETISFDSFRQYLFASRGEFSVSKHVYVATDSGWFSDKSAAFLACGRPVVLQETGFSRHLPVGLGLFAVNTPGEAAEAIEKIENNYPKHAQAAQEIAREYLSVSKVLKQFLSEIGL
jgi:glycosyltransferase involved in cell wall biosynthesis